MGCFLPLSDDRGLVFLSVFLPVSCVGGRHGDASLAALGKNLSNTSRRVDRGDGAGSGAPTGRDEHVEHVPLEESGS